MESDNEVTDQKKSALKVEEKKNYSLTSGWKDHKSNPYWLKLVDHFAIKEKEFSTVSSKIDTILDWAANKSKSKKMADILAVVNNQIKKLPSAGYSERPHTILYRYIKLSSKDNVSN